MSSEKYFSFSISSLTFISISSALIIQISTTSTLTGAYQFNLLRLVDPERFVTVDTLEQAATREYFYVSGQGALVEAGGMAQRGRPLRQCMMSGVTVPFGDPLRCGRQCLRQASDSKAGDEFGQFIHEWPVDRDAERLLREQLATSDENAALAHQPDGDAEHSPLRCVRGKKLTHNIGCGRQIGGRIGCKEFAKDLEWDANSTQRICECSGSFRLGTLMVAIAGI